MKPSVPGSSQEISIEERLDFIGIDAADRQRLKDSAPQVMEAMGPALEAFYARLRSTPEVRRFFSDESAISSAQSRQSSHWGRIVEGSFGSDYVAAVRRIGDIHARIGLDPRWYIGGYGIVLDALIKRMARSQASWMPWRWGRKKAQRGVSSEELSAIVRAALLDMDLSMSMYLENLENDRAKRQAEVASVIAELTSGLRDLAAGNLTRPITTPFAPEFDGLRQDFNSSLEGLATTISQVVEASGSISGRSSEIASAAEDLSRRTENQAASLEQTAAALDEMTASVKSAADSSREVETIVTKARKKAEESGIVVQGAVSAMAEIEKSSEQITQIISAIDDIAFQTNLLALNAGVEAARAGDAGKGFAVVASEVRALAQRSSAAAKEIKTLIATSAQHVRSGVDQVGKAGEALNSIVTSVADISTMVSTIAVGASEQSQGLAEINIAVTQLDQVTQQNAAMVEQTSAASMSLDQDAVGLKELVGVFALPQSAGPESQVVALSKFARKPPSGKVGAAPADANEIQFARVADSRGNAVWQDF